MGKLTLKSEKKNKKRGKNNVSLYCCRFLILLRILGKEEGGLGRFAAALRFELFLSAINQGSFLITFFNFVSRKSTLTIFLPGVPHRYHRKQNLFFHEPNTDIIVDLWILITNITVRSLKTTLFPK